MRPMIPANEVVESILFEGYHEVYAAMCCVGYDERVSLLMMKLVKPN